MKFYCEFDTEKLKWGIVYSDGDKYWHTWIETDGIKELIDFVNKCIERKETT